MGYPFGWVSISPGKKNVDWPIPGSVHSETRALVDGGESPTYFPGLKVEELIPGLSYSRPLAECDSISVIIKCDVGGAVGGAEQHS